MILNYTPKNTCAEKIEINLSEDGNFTVENIRFFGGCAGNTTGVSALCRGRSALDIIPLIKDIDCGGRGTSCPAELAKALTDAISKDTKNL